MKSPILGVDFLRAHRLMVDAAETCLVQSSTGRRFAAISKASGPTAAIITSQQSPASLSGERATCGTQSGTSMAVRRPPTATCGKQGGVAAAVSGPGSATCGLQGSTAIAVSRVPLLNVLVPKHKWQNVLVLFLNYFNTLK